MVTSPTGAVELDTPQLEMKIQGEGNSSMATTAPDAFKQKLFEKEDEKKSTLKTLQ